MIKTLFGDNDIHSIEWSGKETLVHIDGKLSISELKHSISMLTMALEARRTFDYEDTQLDMQTHEDKL